MKKYKVLGIVILVLLIIIITEYFVGYRNSEKYAHTTALQKGDRNEVIVDKTLPEILDKSLITGNKEDLISFSILPNTKVHGILSYRGVIQGAYFFEANILINILDSNKKVLKNSYTMSTTDWMTAGPVNFEGNIDFTNLPKGSAYFEIQNDDPSGGEGGPAKKILIPIIIE